MEHKWARMDGDTAIEVTDIDPAGRFAQEIVWIEVPPETVPHSRIVDGSWVHPVLPAPGNGQPQLPDGGGISIPVAQAINAVTKAIDLKRDVLIAAGKPHDFPDGQHGTVQLRDDRDRTSVNAVATAGTILLLTGDTSSTVDFRDDENVTHYLTGAQAAKFGIDVLAWISKRYDAAWKHKDAVATIAVQPGATSEQIMAYDFTSGWED